MMQTGTECIREFMAGYRQGRDQEVDKMLNEYFKEYDDNKISATTTQDGKVVEEETTTSGSGDDAPLPEKRRKRRKPRRGIPRD